LTNYLLSKLFVQESETNSFSVLIFGAVGGRWYTWD